MPTFAEQAVLRAQLGRVSKAVRVRVRGRAQLLPPRREALLLARSRASAAARARRGLRRALDLGRRRARPLPARSHCAAVDIRGGAGAGAFPIFCPLPLLFLCAALLGALGHREARPPAKRRRALLPRTIDRRHRRRRVRRKRVSRRAILRARSGSDAPRRKTPRRAPSERRAPLLPLPPPPRPPRLIRTSSARPAAATQRAVRACCGARRCRSHASPPPLHRCPVPPPDDISPPALPLPPTREPCWSRSPARKHLGAARKRHTHTTRGAARRGGRPEAIQTFG